jgi:hypothetical protein
VTFSLDGVGYEIDLNTKNADKLRKLFTPYVEKARKIGTRRPGRSVRRVGARSTHRRDRAAQVRAWAKQHGIDVNERGRIPSRIAEAYEAGDPPYGERLSFERLNSPVRATDELRGSSSVTCRRAR